MAQPPIGRWARPLLALLLLLILDLVDAADHEANNQCTFTKFTSAQRARRWILIFGIVVVISLFVMWAYAHVAKQRYLTKSIKMERHTAAEEILSTILKNFSIESLHSFTFHGIKPKVDLVDIEFNDLRTTIPSQRSIMTGFKEQPGKVLLAGVTGEFRPGRMAAIMGPSGAGKTTLLNVLCGKIRDGDWKVEGSVKINGEEKDIEELKPVMGFVPQDDIVHEGLTVRENIRFSAELRCARGTSRKELNKITEDVLKVLQLEAQQNIVVGNRAMGAGGLSGGQRKRVNIGLELAACPTLLFLDEPTSGLDSTTSLLLCSMLKKMTDLGMTIVMVIHQPRYGLFTLIDDVLLLGKGGRTAYVGPTGDAKKYLEALGFQMPANENPADWMMDILSGQNLPVENPKMPTKTLPGALFDAWEKRNEAPQEPAADISRFPSIQWERSNTRGRAMDWQDIQDVVRHEVEEQWGHFSADGGPLDVEGFTAFLSDCVGFNIGKQSNSTAIVNEIMDEVYKAEPVLNGSLTASMGLKQHFVTKEARPEKIHREAFIEYMVNFRKMESPTYADGLSASDESSSEGSSSDTESGGVVGCPCSKQGGKRHQGYLDRAQPGCCTHLKVVMHRSLVQWWRRMTIRMMFIGVIEFAALFLGVFDAVIFESPPWMPTTILNSHVSIALLVSVYCLQTFSRDQPVYWREASHGLNRFAFMIGRMTVDTLDVLFLCFFFTATYYCIVLPELNFEIYFIPFFLVGCVASGWGYLLSAIVPPILAPFCAAVLCFMVGGILGLPQKMTIFLDGGYLEVIADTFCFTRWSIPMDFLAYDWCGILDLSDYKDDPIITQQYHMYKQGYNQTHFQLDVDKSPWYTGLFALTLMSWVLRLATYPALRFVNADKQR